MSALLLAPQNTQFYIDNTQKLYRENPNRSSNDFSDYQIKILNGNIPSYEFPCSICSTKICNTCFSKLDLCSCSVLLPKCMRSYDPFPQWEGLGDLKELDLDLSDLDSENFDSYNIDDDYRSNDISDKPYDWSIDSTNNGSSYEDYNETSYNCKFFRSPQGLFWELLVIHNDSSEMSDESDSESEDDYDSRTIYVSKFLSYK